MRVTGCLLLTALSLFAISSDEATAAPAVGDERLDEALRAIVSRERLDGDPRNGRDVPRPNDPAVVLGKKLFFSTLLGGDADVSCATCHHPLLGGGDALSLSVGVGAVEPALLGAGREQNGDRNVDPNADGGPNVPRNAPTTFNAGLFEKALFWDGRVHELAADGAPARIRTPESRFNSSDPRVSGLTLLAAQSRFPVVSPVEMLGFGELNRFSPEEIRARLAARFADHFDMDAGERLTFDRVSETLASYQRSQVFVDNPWSGWVQGKDDSLSSVAKRGAVRFFEPIADGGAGCFSCHSTDHFTDEEFHRIAVPQFGRGKDNEHRDIGRSLVTGQASDRFAFRTASLLNVEVTAPYGHSGAFLTLADVVRHHLDVEKSLESFDYALAHLPQFAGKTVDRDRIRRVTREAYDEMVRSGDRARLPKGPADPTAVAELVAFLEALTDPCVESPECLRPWLPGAADGAADAVNAGTRIGEPVRISVDSLPASELATRGDPTAEYVEGESDGGSREPVGFHFEEVTAKAGLSYELEPSGHDDEWHMVSGGAAVGDYDGDGWPDVLVSHGKNGTGRLFRNRGDGSFEDRTTLLALKSGPAPVYDRGGLLVDVDEDGHVDILVVDDSPQAAKLHRNRGDGTFEDATSATGLKMDKQTYSVAAADFDRDGDLDLFFGHWGVTMTEGAPLTGYLWRNLGKGRFEDVTRLAPLRLSTFAGQPILYEVVFSPTFSDVDGDGYPDLLLASDFRSSQVLLNRNGFQFTDATDWVISDENGMGSAVGDYDGDGDMDWFVSSIWNPADTKPYVGGESGNRLYRNEGRGKFRDVTDEAGVRKGFWGWGACFADFDNDRDLDLLHVNGMGNNDSQLNLKHKSFLQDPARVFVNDGKGSFAERSRDVGITHTGQGRGVSCFDYDRDGDIDVLVANNGRAPNLYRNDVEPGRHWLRVRLEGPRGNSQGVGARVVIRTGNEEQTRELRLGSNYLSNDPVEAHFGLGSLAKVDRLQVFWPDGTTSKLRDVAVDRELVVRVGGGEAVEGQREASRAARQLASGRAPH